MPDIKAVKKEEVLSPKRTLLTDTATLSRASERLETTSMRPEAVPVAQKRRPVAYYQQELLMKWLEQCLEEVGDL